MNSSVTKQPLISVIVPVYNIIPYLPRCVESLRTQTYENLEILLIDDGSTDETPALCDRLATEDERIRVFHKKNGGPSSARNFGLQQAGGEYVGFVDSDDYVDADMYERLYGAIEKTGMPVAQVGRDEIDKDGNILPNICEPVATEQVIPAEGFLKELLMHRGDCSFCTKLLRKVDKKYPELSEIAFRFGIFQRLDYLLHIPIAQMTGDNAFYRRVVRDLRHGWWRAMKNPWLTKKNKCYHTLFAIAPKGIRVLHKKLKHIE